MQRYQRQFYAAVSRRDHRSVSNLLDNGDVSVDQPWEMCTDGDQCRGDHPLVTASRTSFPIALTLISHGADINARNSAFQSVLSELCSRNIGKKLIRRFLQLGTDLESYDLNGCTALHQACSAWIADMLITAGANMEARDKNGFTPLLNAIRKCNWRVVLLLLESGAVPIGIGPNNSTALHSIAYHYNYDSDVFQDIMVHLYSYVESPGGFAKSTPLFSAVHSGRLENVNLLISYRANVNARDSLNRTPLHWACRRQKPFEIVELLLKSGADIDAENGYGARPIECVTDITTAKLLLRMGANIEGFECDHGGILELVERAGWA